MIHTITDSLTLSGFIALRVHGINKDITKDGTLVRWRNLRIRKVKAAATP